MLLNLILKINLLDFWNPLFSIPHMYTWKYISHRLEVFYNLAFLQTLCISVPTFNYYPIHVPFIILLTQ